MEKKKAEGIKLKMYNRWGSIKVQNEIQKNTTRNMSRAAD